MSTVIFILILGAAYMLGAWGFGQIVGSIQNLKTRPIGIITILIWAAILFAGYYIVKRYLPSDIIGLYVGYVISLVMVLGAGKIK